MMLDECLSQITEVAMLQRAIAAYRRIARSRRKTAARRRSVPLNVLILEERATPAGTDSFLAPIHPPEAVLVAQIPPVSFPPQSSISNGNLANAAVRSDLFGVGGAGKPEQVNELEEMLANINASKENDARELKAHRQATAAAEQAEDTTAAGTVVIEDMEYLPRVD
jgi:hypothetical protein